MHNNTSLSFLRPAAPRAGRSLVTVALCVTLALQGPGATALFAAQERIAYAPLFGAFFDRVASARRQIDRSVFDLSALSPELTFGTPEEQLAWVRDTVAFEQYRGLLRGAQGTLMAQAGNALDQAVLLAGLMGDAGYDTRIARGQLSASDARALVLQMAERRPVLPTLEKDLRAALLDVREAGRAAAAVGDLGLDTPAEPLQFDSLAARASSAAEVVLERLAEFGVGAKKSVLAWLTEEARQYFWVEYREGPSKPWQEAHPAFVSAEAPVSLEPLEYFSAAVPAEYQHRLRIDITIEQKLGGNLRTHVLLDGWERPVANLNGVPLTVAIAPWSLGAWKDLQDPLEYVMKNGVFVALFMGAVTSDLAFDTNGNVVPLAEANAAAAALFQTIGRQFEIAGAALSGLGRTDAEDPEDFAALTALWIDYTLIAPGGEEKTFRRTVIDRIGPEKRAAGRAEISSSRTEFLPLIGIRSAMIATGGVPAAFAVDRNLEALLESRIFLEYLARQATEYDPEALFPKEGGVSPGDLRPLDLFQLFDLAPQSGAIAYRAEPTLVVIGESYGGTREEVIVERYVDIVQNAKRVFVAADDDLLAGIEKAVRAGVWDTIVEGLLVGRRPATVARFGAVDHIETALRDGRELFVLQPSDASSTATAAYGAKTAAGITRDLAAGYSVLVPAPDARDGDRTAWWRVRLETGETLGIISDGRGAILEAIVMVAIIAIGFMIKAGMERNKCRERIQGQSGYDLKLQNPREYEKLVASCNIGIVFWEANRFVDDELDRHEEICELNVAVSAIPWACD